MLTFPLFEINLHLLSMVALSGFQSSLSKVVPGKFHGCDRHSKCNCLQDWANFHRSRVWQVVLIFTRDQFWPLSNVVACICWCVSQSVCFNHLYTCLRDNSWPIRARTTKFGPEVQNTLLKIFTVLGGNWYWPSRATLSNFKVKFYPFLSLKFVRGISHHPFKLGSPNLDQRCQATLLRPLVFGGPKNCNRS